MKRELHIFLSAIMYYTRIPCPSWLVYEDDHLTKSVRYFPLIGWIVGALSALSLWLGILLVNDDFGIVLMLITGILVTGGFHEDGLADFFDGFGGGWSKSQIIRIMKDSRIGTFGTLAVILSILLKFVLLKEILISLTFLEVLLVIISGHSLSRFVTITFVYTHLYAFDISEGKVKPIVHRPGWLNFVLAFLFGFLPLIPLIHHTAAFLLLVPFFMYLIKVLLARFYKKWIDGYTGDCLGATQQITEITHYFFVLMLWKFF